MLSSTLSAARALRSWRPSGLDAMPVRWKSSLGFVDVAIRRWQAFTRRDASHADSGLSFDEIAAEGHSHRSSGGSKREAPSRSGDDLAVREDIVVHVRGETNRDERR
jgi:hypothetical protein